MTKSMTPITQSLLPVTAAWQLGWLACCRVLQPCTAGSHSLLQGRLYLRSAVIWHKQEEQHACHSCILEAVYLSDCSFKRWP